MESRGVSLSTATCQALLESPRLSAPASHARPRSREEGRGPGRKGGGRPICRGASGRRGGRSPRERGAGAAVPGPRKGPIVRRLPAPHPAPPFCGRGGGTEGEGRKGLRE